MYYLSGIAYSVDVIKAAVKLEGELLNLGDEQLISSYEGILRQDSVFEKYSFTSRMKILNFKEFSNICPSYAAQKRDHFSVNSDLLEERINNGFFTRAIETLRERTGGLYQLCQFLIRVVVANQLKSHTNGTTFDTLGVAFLDFKDSYDEEDFIELLIHQAIHMLYFLEHRVSPHISKRNETIMIESNLKYVRGGTAFPAYLAFHSYLVGVEILQYRSCHDLQGCSRNYHGTTDRIFAVCDKFRVCLEEYAYLFSSKGRSVLRNADYLYKELNDLYLGLAS